MSYIVKISGTEYKFTAEPDQTILDAAEKAGYALPCACRSGACGACKGRILAGQADLGQYLSSALSEEEVKNGYALMCRSKPRSDLEIEVRGVKVLQKKAEEAFQVEIVEKTLLNPSILRLVLKRTDGKLFEFKAGQTYAIELPGGLQRFYSVASSELQKETIEFLIRKVTNGMFTGLLFSDALRVGDKMKLKGPQGDAHFRTPKGKKAIFLSTGTGIAPVKSIIQTLIEKDDLKDRSLHIFWGVRTQEDLVLSPLFNDWAAHYPQITYTPVVSRDPEWKGATGHVQTVAAEGHGDMTQTDVYICGNNSLIKAATNFLTVRCGLDDKHIYSDNFGG